MEYIWDSSIPMRLSQISSTLSTKLRKDLLVQYNTKTIEYCSIITDNFSKKFIIEIA